jgi:hypothetical protein
LQGDIDDDCLAAPQAQDLPHDEADISHIEVFDNAARLDVLLKSFVQSIEFIRRFRDEHWRLRQKR